MLGHIFLYILGMEGGGGLQIIHWHTIACPYFSINIINIYYIPSSEILEFPSVIDFDITSDDINFHFHFLP